MPSSSNQKGTQGSKAFQKKKKVKQSENPKVKANKKDTPAPRSSKKEKPRSRSNKKNAPAPRSSKTKNYAARLSDKITEMPYEDSSSMAQPCNSFQLSGELPPANTIRLPQSNSNDQCSHIHIPSMPSSVTVLNQLSNRNNTTNPAEGHTSTQMHQSFTDQHCDSLSRSLHQEPVNQFSGHDTQTIPIHHPVNTYQNETMPQTLSTGTNRTPGRMLHSMIQTQETPSVFQSNHMQNTFSRQLFQPRANVSCPRPSRSTPNPSTIPRGNRNLGYFNHPRMPFSPNPTNFYSKMTNHPVQQAPAYSDFHHINQVNQPLPTRGPPDQETLPLTQHCQQAHTVQHFVHYVNPPPNSLPGSVGQHTFQNHQFADNIHTPNQRQGISTQGTATSQVFNFKQHVSHSTQQQHQNTRGQTQQHSVFIPFYCDTPIEIEIK